MPIQWPVKIKAQAAPVPSGVRPSSHAHRLHVLIRQEPKADGDGFDFSAYALNLPGVGSMGATRDEALANIHEAASAAIASYLKDDEEIPWRDDDRELAADSDHKWIIVHAHA